MCAVGTAPDLASLLPDVSAPFRWLVSDWGSAPGPAARYGVARWLFLKVVAGVYLAAFLSLVVQVRGLLGERGILPAGDFLQRMRRAAGGRDLARAPTLFWWRSDDRALLGACWAGVGLSALLMAGVAPVACLLLLWALYLSFAAVGQVFLSYQWDVLLLEAGFLAAFLAPWGVLPGAGGPVPALALVLAWWLLFRLVFQSGVGKLTSGDPAWRDLTALEYHWWTQPLPTWTAWYVDKLPAWWHRAATLGTHLLEILVPLLIFGPRELRLVAFAGIVLLQVLIFLTGNYNFFNVLTVGLALLLLDDGVWAGVLPEVLLEAGGGAAPATAGGGSGVVRSVLTLGLAAVVAGVTLPRVWRTLFPRRDLPAGMQRLLRKVDPLRTFNSYGLFRVMTKKRPEIVVQGSRDGETWEDYEFRWKPGDPSRRPRFCEPHQPRLDWQMWFAALGTFQQNAWFRAFLARLLEGSGPVEALLERTPFGEEPPPYVRAVLYEYRFTGWRERRRTGRWWQRERVGLYAPPLARQEASSP